MNLPMPNPSNMSSSPAIDVDWLSGGAMSFRRDVLDSIGALDGLFRAACKHADRQGGRRNPEQSRTRARTLAADSRPARAPSTARCGDAHGQSTGRLSSRTALETWGRAHTMRWLAADAASASQAWRQVASLEVARACKTAVRQPMKRAHWQRLAATWSASPARCASGSDSPEHPDQSSGVTTMMFFWDYDTRSGRGRTDRVCRTDGHGASRIFPTPTNCWVCTPNSGSLPVLPWSARRRCPAAAVSRSGADSPVQRPLGHEIASHAFTTNGCPGSVVSRSAGRCATARMRWNSASARRLCRSCRRSINLSILPALAPSVSPSVAKRACSGPRCVACARHWPRPAIASAASPMFRWPNVWASGSAVRPRRPLAPVTIGGITCVRIGPCGFDAAQVHARCRRPRRVGGAPVVLYGHPHSLHVEQGSQSVADLRQVLAMAAVADPQRCDALHPAAAVE